MSKEKPKTAPEREFMTSVGTVLTLSLLPLFDGREFHVNLMAAILEIPDPKRTPAAEEENSAAHSNLAPQEVLPSTLIH